MLTAIRSREKNLHQNNSKKTFKCRHGDDGSRDGPDTALVCLGWLRSFSKKQAADVFQVCDPEPSQAVFCRVCLFIFFSEL